MPREGSLRAGEGRGLCPPWPDFSRATGAEEGQEAELQNWHKRLFFKLPSATVPSAWLASCRNGLLAASSSSQSQGTCKWQREKSSPALSGGTVPASYPCPAPCPRPGQRLAASALLHPAPMCKGLAGGQCWDPGAVSGREIYTLQILWELPARHGALSLSAGGARVSLGGRVVCGSAQAAHE